jgi:hypothetical protein
MACKLCTKRITRNTYHFNKGYCEDCLTQVAFMLLENHEDDIDHIAWRRQKRQALEGLLKELTEAGMPNPMSGFSPETHSLAQRLYVGSLNNLR